LGQFPSLTYPPFNRLALVIPKRFIFYPWGCDIAAGAYTFLASVGCIWLCYRLGLLLLDGRAARTAALLMATSSFDIAYASQPWDYDIILSMWLALTVLSAIEYSATRRIAKLIVGAIAFWLAYRTKITAMLLLGPLLFLCGSAAMIANASRLRKSSDVKSPVRSYLEFTAACSWSWSWTHLWCGFTPATFFLTSPPRATSTLTWRAPSPAGWI